MEGMNRAGMLTAKRAHTWCCSNITAVAAATATTEVVFVVILGCQGVGVGGGVVGGGVVGGVVGGVGRRGRAGNENLRCEGKYCKKYSDEILQKPPATWILTEEVFAGFASVFGFGVMLYFS